MVFHLTKQARYYAAVDEIREPHEERWSANHRPGNQNGHKTTATGMNLDLAGARKPPNPLGKLPGSVWSIPSQPLIVPPELGIDHFASFPMELPRRCVLGWSPPGVCTVCGEGRRPVVEQSSAAYRATRAAVQAAGKDAKQAGRGHQQGWMAATAGAASLISHQVVRPEHIITGYACACPQPDAPATPALVLDPFAGTGTTMLVASALGRIGIGVDRSMDYARLARWRTRDRGEIAKAMQVPKPPVVPDGQAALFEVKP
jgi:hypothetical protein